MNGNLHRFANGEIDLDGLTDHCECGSHAKFVHDSNTDGYKVACSDCANETDFYGCKYRAAIMWNRQVRKMKGDVTPGIVKK